MVKLLGRKIEGGSSNPNQKISSKDSITSTKGNPGNDAVSRPTNPPKPASEMLKSRKNRKVTNPTTTEGTKKVRIGGGAKGNTSTKKDTQLPALPSVPAVMVRIYSLSAETLVCLISELGAKSMAAKALADTLPKGKPAEDQKSGDLARINLASVSTDIWMNASRKIS
jgi:hypothetical protein